MWVFSLSRSLSVTLTSQYSHIAGLEYASSFILVYKFSGELLIIQESLCFLFESLYLICIVLFNLILTGIFYASSECISSVDTDLKGTVWEFCFDFWLQKFCKYSKTMCFVSILFIFHSLFVHHSHVLCNFQLFKLTKLTFQTMAGIL